MTQQSKTATFLKKWRKYVPGASRRISDLEIQADDLREDKQKLLVEAAERTDLQSCMNDIISFLDELSSAITEYSEVLTRRLVKRVAIFDEKIVVEMKSGLEMEVEAWTN